MHDVTAREEAEAMSTGEHDGVSVLLGRVCSVGFDLPERMRSESSASQGLTTPWLVSFFFPF